MKLFQLLLTLLILFLYGCTTISKESINIGSIVNKNTGNILYPKHVNANQWKPIPVGYKVKYLNTDFSGETYTTEYVFTSTQNDEYHFLKYHDGKLDSNTKYMIKEGREYYSYKNEAYKLNARDPDCDIYFIGRCKTGRRIGKYSNTSFSEGTWTKQHRGLGLTQITHKTVYDRHGLILFYSKTDSNIAQGTSFTQTKVRVDKEINKPTDCRTAIEACVR
ncbi:hypothetical protein [Litoribrevibacter albus]|uniref:Lipoprotein n=1 Tax=Litoribrevibacter albus TaxID=1473156 RepID=A0AA37W7Y5_9GAMM|nr:hypothetical protein [Litoribrevibacter albus]GLQ31754.1 hypothetical protein GCM10007876_22330 [Litoribrevibacter albus]